MDKSPDKPKKRDPVEEAHFRIDEHERKFTELGKAADAVPAMVHGGVAALEASMQAKLDKIIAAQAEDIETDRAVVKAIGELVEQLKRLSVPAPGAKFGG